MGKAGNALLLHSLPGPALGVWALLCHQHGDLGRMVPPWVLAPVTEADVGMQHKARDRFSEALCQCGAELLEKMPLGFS